MIWGKTKTERIDSWQRHSWFAWYPVRLSNEQWAWWHWVERRYFGAGNNREVEYFFKKDLTNV